MANNISIIDQALINRLIQILATDNGCQFTAFAGDIGAAIGSAAAVGNNFINNNVITLQSYSNMTRPAASSMPGAQIFNTDDNAPNYSNGVNWYDAVGNLT